MRCATLALPFMPAWSVIAIATGVDSNRQGSRDPAVVERSLAQRTLAPVRKPVGSSVRPGRPRWLRRFSDRFSIVRCAIGGGAVHIGPARHTSTSWRTLPITRTGSESTASK